MTTDTRDDLVREIARLRSIVHRAEAQILSYNTRAGLQILDEVCAPEDHREVEIPAPVQRILWNKRGEDIDEIVLRNVETVHIEQMDDRCWWIGIHLPDDAYWAGNFTCDSRGRMRFNEQETWGFEWDSDDSHEMKT